MFQLLMCVASLKLLDLVGLLFQDGTSTARQANARNSVLEDVKETQTTLSKYSQNVNARLQLDFV